MGKSSKRHRSRSRSDEVDAGQKERKKKKKSKKKRVIEEASEEGQCTEQEEQEEAQLAKPPKKHKTKKSKKDKSNKGNDKDKDEAEVRVISRRVSRSPPEVTRRRELRSPEVTRRRVSRSPEIGRKSPKIRKRSADRVLRRRSPGTSPKFERRRLREQDESERSRERSHDRFSRGGNNDRRRTGRKIRSYSSAYGDDVMQIVRRSISLLVSSPTPGGSGKDDGYRGPRRRIEERRDGGERGRHGDRDRRHNRRSRSRNRTRSRSRERGERERERSNFVGGRRPINSPPSRFSSSNSSSGRRSRDNRQGLRRNSRHLGDDWEISGRQNSRFNSSSRMDDSGKREDGGRSRRGGFGAGNGTERIGGREGESGAGTGAMDARAIINARRSGRLGEDEAAGKDVPAYSAPRFIARKAETSRSGCNAASIGRNFSSNPRLPLRGSPAGRHPFRSRFGSLGGPGSVGRFPRPPFPFPPPSFMMPRMGFPPPPGFFPPARFAGSIPSPFAGVTSCPPPGEEGSSEGQVPFKVQDGHPGYGPVPFMHPGPPVPFMPQQTHEHGEEEEEDDDDGEKGNDDDDKEKQKESKGSRNATAALPFFDPRLPPPPIQTTNQAEQEQEIEDEDDDDDDSDDEEEAFDKSPVSPIEDWDELSFFPNVTEMAHRIENQDEVYDESKCDIDAVCHPPGTEPAVEVAPVADNGNELDLEEVQKKNSSRLETPSPSPSSSNDSDNDLRPPGMEEEALPSPPGVTEQPGKVSTVEHSVNIDSKDANEPPALPVVR